MFADMLKVRAALRQGRPTAAVRAWMEMPAYAATIRDPAAGAEFSRIAADYSFSSRGQREPLKPSAVNRIAEIRAPVLIVTAEHDMPACLEIADLLDRSAPDSTKIVMKETGHLLQIEKPKEFNQYLVEFFARVSR